MRAVLVATLLVLVIAVSAVTGWKIATLPNPGKNQGRDLYTLTKSNADRRRNYLAGGGIVVAALLGTASIVAYSLRTG